MKEDNLKFIEWYQGLLPHEKRFFKNQIVLACEVSALTFTHWLKGECNIKNPYRRLINEISGKELFPTIQLATLSN